MRRRTTSVNRSFDSSSSDSLKVGQNSDSIPAEHMPQQKFCRQMRRFHLSLRQLPSRVASVRLSIADCGFADCTDCGLRIVDCGLSILISEFQSHISRLFSLNLAIINCFPFQSAICNLQSAIVSQSAIRNPKSAIETGVSTAF